MKDLDSQILTGIRAALAAIDSPLTSVIDRIKSQPPSFTPSGQPGSSIYPRYSISVTPDEGLNILTLLLRVESQRGYDAIFEERQINFLANQWKQAISAQDNS